MARTKKAKPAVKKTAKITTTKAVKKPVKAAVSAVKPAAKAKKITAKKTTKVVKATKATKAVKATKAPKVAKVTKAKKVVKATKAPKITKASKVSKIAKVAKSTKKVAKAPKAKKNAPISFEKQLKESARQIKAFEKTLNSLHTQVTKAYKQQATLQSKLANTDNKKQIKKFDTELTKLNKGLVKLINAFEDTKTDVITAKLDAEQAEALLAHMDAFENTWLDEIEMRISAIVMSLPNLPEPTEVEAVSTAKTDVDAEEDLFEIEDSAENEDEDALELDFEQDYPADVTSDLESEEMAD